MDPEPEVEMVTETFNGLPADSGQIDSTLYGLLDILGQPDEPEEQQAAAFARRDIAERNRILTGLPMT